MTGPLEGVRVVELAGVGPAPFAAMLLGELGADVVRVDRPSSHEVMAGRERVDLLNRGKRSVQLDLKRPEAVEAALGLVAAADVLVEGYRPGVAERLGLGPQDCWARRPSLVYGRVTGWGQDGPLAERAGHDVDYVALTGALHAIGGPQGPVIPLNLVGDFGGGACYLVIGVLAALLEARTSGRGQVVDAAIVDGAASLMTAVHMLSAIGLWGAPRGENLLDGGAPYYALYRCADGEHLAVGAVENRFYRELLERLGLDLDPRLQNDASTWPATRAAIAAAVAERTRQEWADLFADSDACAAPVLSTSEAAEHPHVRARGSLVVRDGVLQSGPAPRFSRTQEGTPSRPPLPGEHTRGVLEDWGVGGVAELLACGAAVQTTSPDQRATHQQDPGQQEPGQ